MEQYGRYTLLSKLATGGMAQVFLARPPDDAGFGELVVVKRILPHLAENEEFVRMFLQEARVAARLNHPNISQVFDLGKVDDTFYIAMEYVHGEDLRRVVREAATAGRTLPVPLACRIVAGACAGLAFAHDAQDEAGRPLNIVHRDVSPQNLLVTFDGELKVIDFGIAKAADSANHTRTGVLKGKYSYMSPEQAEGRRLDRRSDVFALGVVLWELVARQRLFKRQSDLSTVQAVTSCQVTPPSELNPEVPPALDAILLRALARDPAKRTASAAVLAAELEEFLTRHRLPASPAHLRAFMRETYAERVAEEERLGQITYEDNLLAASQPRAAGASVDSARAHSKSPPERPRGAPLPPPVPGVPLSGLARGGAAAPPRPPDLDSSEVTTEGRAKESPLRRMQGQAALAPMPGRPARLTGPVLAPALDEHDLSEVSRVVRRLRTRRALVATLTLAAFVVAGAGAVLLLARPGVFGPPDGRARLRVSSQPPGAEIVLDDRPTGKVTPAVLEVEAGVGHELALRLDGYEPRAETLAPFRDELARDLRLERRRVGALRVETTPPGAAIVLDGRRLASTSPAVLPDLDAGRPHSLALVLEGHEDAVLEIRVKEGAVTPVSRVLKRTAIAAPPPPPVEAPASGTLIVVTQPAGLAVTVDGKPAGTTPVDALLLAPGKHVVKLSDPARLLERTETITVTAGAPVRLERTYRPRRVRFNVRPFARVYVDGRHVADSPGDAELFPGRYELRYFARDQESGFTARRDGALVVPEGEDLLVISATLRNGEGGARAAVP